MKKIYKSITETFNLLDTKNKKLYFIILFLFLINAILESFGIGLIFAMLTTLTQGGFNFDFPFINLFLEDIDFIKETKNILIVIVILYLFKSIFLNFFFWFTTKYVLDAENFIAKKLYTGYLYSPLTFHLNENSSELIRNITVETGQFSGGSLTNSLHFFKNIFLLISLLLLLLLINPFVTISAFIFLLIIAATNHLIMSKKYYLWGKERQIEAGLRLRQLQQGFLGIKAVKFFGKEIFFFLKFLPHLYKINHIRLKQTFFKQFPRIWLEFFSVLGCVVLFFILSGKDDVYLNALPLISVLALVLMRMMPAITSLINNFQSFDFSYASIEKIKSDFKRFENNEKKYQNKKEIIFDKKLEFKNVNFQYNKNTKKVLNNINLKIEKNSTIGIVGSSGAGKTTLLNIFLGLLHPDSGSIEIDDIKILDYVTALQKKIGYVPQEIFLTDESIKNNIAFGIDEKEINQDKLDRAIYQSQLHDFIDALPSKDETLVGELGDRISGGEKQRIGIARALYNDPDILVLDEATKSLDAENAKKINEVIEKLINKKTIIIVSHIDNSLEKCEQIYQLKNGLLEKTK